MDVRLKLINNHVFLLPRTISFIYLFIKKLQPQFSFIHVTASYRSNAYMDSRCTTCVAIARWMDGSAHYCRE